ncbi:hypothetical protein [Pigmentiphaga kullae]|uniref:Uncharacterized protein n=1 Tax=Pigmentiphaga kullae TaxID=151784 RepID=A0A4Q7NJ75_9BURK|nr:hypothetical protein [Pigmentiphaga kullae]RZS84938.1 hypothetical protein EV675_0959 [Pigmentiphaga kullae]
MNPNRRMILNGGMAGTLLALLAACGGSGGTDPSGQPDGDAGDYRHATGIDTLPASRPLDLDALALPTEGQTFGVRVMLGGLPQAGVRIQVLDVRGALVDEGTADAQGFFRSARIGRRFLMAVAQTPQGELYGFEYNHETKTDPVVDVNLVPTLAFRLSERLKLSSPNAIDFVVKEFLGLDYSVLLSDLEARGAAIDQDRLRQEAAASGLGLQGYLDATVEKIVRAIDQGFPPAIDTAPLPVRKTSFLAAAHDQDASCDDVPEYDDGVDENIPSDLARLIREHWSTAAKALIAFAFKKAASASGFPIIGDVGNLILDALFPARNPVMDAVAALDSQIKGLARSIEELLRRQAQAEFNRTFDAVRSAFNTFDGTKTLIDETNAFYTKTGIPIDDNYRLTMTTQCLALFLRESALIEAHNQFVGLGSFASAGVLNRWMPVGQGEKFYTAAIQQQYIDLLDWYQARNALAYGYLIDAYDAYAKLTGGAVNTSRIQQLKERLERQTANVEKLRPKYLYSQKQFIDVGNRLTWVGRCNKAESFLDLIPADVKTTPGWNPGRLDLAKMMRHEQTDPCESRGVPTGNASLGPDLIAAYPWRLPTRKNLEDSFAEPIKQKYGKKFNLKTFAYDFQLSRSVSFFLPDSDTPAEALLSSGLKSIRVKIARGYYVRHFEGDVFAFQDLSARKQTIDKRGKDKYSGPPLYFFPVATVTLEQLNALLPWAVYDKAIRTMTA